VPIKGLKSYTRTPKVKHRDIETGIGRTNDRPRSAGAWGIKPERPDPFRWKPKPKPIEQKVEPRPAHEEDEETRLRRKAETLEILQRKQEDLPERDMWRTRAPEKQMKKAIEAVRAMITPTSEKQGKQGTGTEQSSGTESQVSETGRNLEKKQEKGAQKARKQEGLAKTMDKKKKY
jgi:hypothetical protein